MLEPAILIGSRGSCGDTWRLSIEVSTTSVASSGLTAVYTGKTSKISEHGGDTADDRHVPLVVSGAGAKQHNLVNQRVETTQIAPTILALLGLDPSRLDAVRGEHTRVLPHVRAD